MSGPIKIDGTLCGECSFRVPHSHEANGDIKVYHNGPLVVQMHVPMSETPTVSVPPQHKVTE